MFHHHPISRPSMTVLNALCIMYTMHNPQVSAETCKGCKVVLVNGNGPKVITCNNNNWSSGILPKCVSAEDGDHPTLTL